MNLKPGMNILPSSYTTLARISGPACPLLVWAGRAIAFKNRLFMPHFGASLLRTGGLLYLLTLDL